MYPPNNCVNKPTEKAAFHHARYYRDHANRLRPQKQHVSLTDRSTWWCKATGQHQNRIFYVMITKRCNLFTEPWCHLFGEVVKEFLCGILKKGWFHGIYTITDYYRKYRILGKVFDVVLHWKPRVVTMLTSSSLVAPQVVVIIVPYLYWGLTIQFHSPRRIWNNISFNDLLRVNVSHISVPHTPVHIMTSTNGNIFRVTGHLWIHRSPMNSPDKGEWRGALMFSLILTNDWANHRDAGDLRRHRAHYDVFRDRRVA